MVQINIKLLKGINILIVTIKTLFYITINNFRNKWYVDKELAGYVKTAGYLTEVLVRNAGHMVPADQPSWALDLISRFTRNKTFY